MFAVIATWMSMLTRDDEGQSMVEYGLILALIAVVSVALFATVGGQVSAALTSLVGAF